MLKGCLLNHLGWADIFNSLSIINYYSKIYDYLYVLMREDAQDILQFYTRNIFNVKMLYLDKNIIIELIIYLFLYSTYIFERLLSCVSNVTEISKPVTIIFCS